MCQRFPLSRVSTLEIHQKRPCTSACKRIILICFAYVIQLVRNTRSMACLVHVKPACVEKHSTALRGGGGGLQCFRPTKRKILYRRSCFFGLVNLLQPLYSPLLLLTLQNFNITIFSLQCSFFLPLFPLYYFFLPLFPLYYYSFLPLFPLHYYFFLPLSPLNHSFFLLPFLYNL